MNNSTKSDEEKQANVKQESDVKQEVKTDPDGNPLPKKLESGQHENETLAEFKDRFVSIFRLKKLKRIFKG